MTGIEAPVINDSLSVEKAQRLVRGIATLPTIPAICLRVSTLLASPTVDLQKVADLILSDQVLTARVVKIVNSPLFRPLHEITSLRHALVYLGLRRINEIVLSCSLIQAFEGGDAGFDLRTFWQHSFGVGIIARKMAQLLAYPELEKVYVYGLLHNIGKVFLCSYLKPEWAKIIRLVEEKGGTFLDAEMRTMGTTHCEIGLCLARQWNFPEEYCDVIAYHHVPANSPRNQLPVALVNLADIFYTLCQGMDGDSGWTSSNLTEEPSWFIMRKSLPALDDFDPERFAFELEEEMPGIRKLVNDLFMG